MGDRQSTAERTRMSSPVIGSLSCRTPALLVLTPIFSRVHPRRTEGPWYMAATCRVSGSVSFYSINACSYFLLLWVLLRILPAALLFSGTWETAARACVVHWFVGSGKLAQRNITKLQMGASRLRLFQSRNYCSSILVDASRVHAVRDQFNGIRVAHMSEK